MKLSKLVDPQFQAALRKLSTQEIPLRAAFKLRGIIKQVSEELAKYDEVRTAALKGFSDKDDAGEMMVEGNNVKMSPENMEAFVGQLNELLVSDVTVGSFKVTELGEKLSITAGELMLLEDIVTE